MDAGGRGSVRSSSRYFQRKNAREMENLDRFIPNRSAMDFDYAKTMLTRPITSNEGVTVTAYGKRLAEALNLNRTRILAFKNKPPAPVELFPPNFFAENIKPPKPLRHFGPNSDRTLDAMGMVDDYCLNLLDWGSRGVLAIALNNSVYMWDPTDGNGSVYELVPCEDEGVLVKPTSVSWAPDGCRIAIGLNNYEVELWDSITKRKLSTLSGCHRLPVCSLAWNNNDMLTTGGMDGHIFNHDVRTRSSRIVNSYRGHGQGQEVCGLKWSPSGQQLASGGTDNLVYIWDKRRSAQWLHRLEDHSDAVRALAWYPFEANLLASGGGASDRCIKFWDTQAGSCLNSVYTGSEVCALLWNKNERELLSSHGEPGFQLTLWKYPSMAKIAQLTDHKWRVLYMAQSPDGCTVASAAGDERLNFWNVFGVPEVARANHEPFAQFNRIR